MAGVSVVPSQARKVTVARSETARIGHDGVAAALGAEPYPVSLPEMATPLSFAAVRQLLAHELRSTGGRPGFARAERRKIPVTATAWRTVEDVAEALAEEGFRPSPAQVASVLLSLAARALRSPDVLANTRHVMKAARSLRSEHPAPAVAASE